MLIRTSMVVADEPSSAVQKRLVRGVSVVSVWLMHVPGVLTASDGSTVHSRLTSDRYHPLQSVGAGVHFGVTLGAAAAPGAVSSATTQTRTAAATARRARRTAVPGTTASCGLLLMGRSFRTASRTMRTLTRQDGAGQQPGSDCERATNAFTGRRTS